MKFTVKLVSASVLAIAASVASAQEGISFYGEAGYTFGEVEIADADSANVGLLGVTLGANVHEYLAVEVMFAGGVADDDIDLSLDDGWIEGEANIEVKNTYGVFLKPKVNLTEELEIFAKIGWVQSELSLDADLVDYYWEESYSISESDSDDSFAYAVGAQYSFLPNAYVSASYVSLYDDDDVELSGWNLSVGMKF